LKPKVVFLITCEHSSNAVPKELRYFFKSHPQILQTHAAYDLGAMKVAKHLSKSFGSKLFQGEFSRLVFDLNRSPDHPKVIHPMVRAVISDADTERYLRQHQKHRDSVHDWIESKIDNGLSVIHLGIHSFTPVFNGKVRRCDRGVLFDPARTFESDAASLMIELSKEGDAQLIIRRNDPYRGTSDGLTTWLRTCFKDRSYAGIEIELNQKHCKNAKIWKSHAKWLSQFITTLNS